MFYATWKLKTCLALLKSSFNQHLKSHVVYKITYSGCNSIQAGLNSRHITMRLAVHQKEDSPERQHVNECCGTSSSCDWFIVNQCNVPQKLMTLKVLQIAKKKPMLNTSDGRSRHWITSQQLWCCSIRKLQFSELKHWNVSVGFREPLILLFCLLC